MRPSWMRKMPRFRNAKKKRICMYFTDEVHQKIRELTAENYGSTDSEVMNYLVCRAYRVKPSWQPTPGLETTIGRAS